MKILRLAIATAACFLGAGALLWRLYSHPLPRREQLERIDATVAEMTVGRRSSKYGEAHFPAIKLRGRKEEFRYLDWFPKPDVIPNEIMAGDQVTLLSDTGRNVWIWELQKDGRTIVSYDQVFAAVQQNNRFDPYLALALLACGIFGAFRLIRPKLAQAG